MRMEDKGSEAETGRDPRRRSRAGDRTGVRDRCGQASGKLCIRAPQPSNSGRRVSRVWDVDATTGAVSELADLLGEGIEKVTVESTSDY